MSDENTIDVKTKAAFEKVAGMVQDIQSELTAANAERKSVDVVTTDKITKLGEAAASALADLNEVKQKSAAEEQARNVLEERLNAVEMAGTKSSDGNEVRDDPEYKQALSLYLKKGIELPAEVMNGQYGGMATKMAWGVDDDKIDMIKKDLIAGSGADGGYFITADRAATMSKRIFETSSLRPLANIVTTTSDVWEQVLDDGEADSGWVGEVQARPDTNTPQIGLIQIPVHELYAQPLATQKMLDDAGFNIEAWLSNKVDSKLGRDENTAFVVGDGSQKPKGFMSYPAWSVAGTYQRDAVEQISSGAATTFTADGLIEVQNSLIEGYQARATWGMKRSSFTDIAQIKQTNGTYLINPNIIAQGADKVLLGKPITFMDDMAAVAGNALAAVYADFSEFYTIVDRFGIRVLRDPYTSKPYVKFYTTKRVGGAVTNYEAGKIVKLAV